MTKIILILALFTGLWADKHPKDITGKWIVENVDIPEEMAAKIPPEQKQMMMAMIKGSFNNVSFDLKADHHCSTSLNLPNMPKMAYWDYDAKKGILKLSEDKDEKDRVLYINVAKSGDKLRFTMQKANVVMTVHKG